MFTSTNTQASSIALRTYNRYGITILLGDCRKILPSIPKSSVHLLVVDGPYGGDLRSTRKAKKYKAVAGDKTLLDIKSVIWTALTSLQRKRHIYNFTRWDKRIDF